MTPRRHPELAPDSRDVKVLRAIIQDYIEHAEPVGSKTLARVHGLDASPATIRNVMADLEALGYLQKPHTSAGRVPTAKAFRFYVDSLLDVRPLAGRARAQADRAYEPPPEEVSARMQHTGRVLHRLTHWAAVVAEPRLADDVYREIRFIRLRENRVLAVLVTRAGLVQNRVFTLDEEVTQGRLDRYGNYLDSLLGRDRTLREVREIVRRTLEADRSTLDDLTSRALELGRRVLEDGPAEPPAHLIVEGAASFLDVPEFADREKIRALLSALDEREQLLRVLERAEAGSGIHIYIGAEAELAQDDLALVLASYRRGDRILGALGVLGPSRMDYARVVPFVQYTAALLTRTFEEGQA